MQELLRQPELASVFGDLFYSSQRTNFVSGTTIIAFVFVIAVVPEHLDIDAFLQVDGSKCTTADDLLLLPMLPH